MGNDRREYLFEALWQGIVKYHKFPEKRYRVYEQCEKILFSSSAYKTTAFVVYCRMRSLRSLAYKSIRLLCLPSTLKNEVSRTLLTARKG